jgi:hypothetical protein
MVAIERVQPDTGVIRHHQAAGRKRETLARRFRDGQTILAESIDVELDRGSAGLRARPGTYSECDLREIGPHGREL